MMHELFYLDVDFFLCIREKIRNLDAEFEFFFWRKLNYMEPPGFRGMIITWPWFPVKEENRPLIPEEYMPLLF